MTFHKETIGDCELYLGDCREIMPTIDVVDAVVTDPPYEKEAHTPNRRIQKSIISNIPASLGFDAITEAQRDDLSKFISTNCKTWSLIFCQAEAITAWRDAIEKHGAKYKRAMAWVKPDSSPQFNGQGPAQGYETIVASWSGNGRSSWNGGGRRGVFTINKHDPEYGHGGSENEHPTKKPIKLMLELLGLFTNPDHTVLDPFMGSGTTGVGCIRLGRKFIGIELDRKHFDTACRRIENTYKQPDMFVPQPERFKQRAFI